MPIAEMLERTNKVVRDYEANAPDWTEIYGYVTHSESDYWVWPELNTFRVVHRSDAREVEVYFEQLVDEDFDEDYLLDICVKLCDKYLTPNTNNDAN